MIPSLALVYLPVLVGVIGGVWPDVPDPAILAGQIEQETCITLAHSKCWNPRAELKTSREYGFGLGQLTVTPAFNNFEAAKGWDKTLSGWAWSARFDPEMQLRALVAYDRNLYRQIKFGADPRERTAFMLSAYNGGLGGLFKDRRLCAASSGCDPERWFGHIERHSFRSRTAVKGYGQSFFAINRGYVANIMGFRSDRYRAVMAVGRDATLAPDVAGGAMKLYR